MSLHERMSSVHNCLSKTFSCTFLVVQWLRLCAPNAGVPGLILGQGTRSDVPATKSLHASTQDPTCRNQDLVQANKRVLCWFSIIYHAWEKPLSFKNRIKPALKVSPQWSLWLLTSISMQTLLIVNVNYIQGHSKMPVAG